MQSTVVEAIERATLEVFALMVGVDVVREILEPGASLGPGWNVVSSFTLSGAVCGRAEVFYTLPFAQCLACHMLQGETPALENDVLDAAGELANIIIGNVKNSLESQLGVIQIGTPAVALVGDCPAVNEAMSVSFRCPEGVFTVSVAFKDDSPSPFN